MMIYPPATKSVLQQFPKAQANILESPLEIYIVARNIFSDTKMDVFSDNKSIKITLQLLPNVPLVELKGAVIKKVFEESLRMLHTEIEWDRLCKKTKLQYASLAVEPFALLKPFSLPFDWQQFRRMYEQSSGHSCLDVLKNYLEGKDTAGTLLFSLGLAPEQIEKKCSDSDRIFFKNFMKASDKKNRGESLRLYAYFSEKYPLTSKSLIKEEGKEAFDKKQKNNSYDENLRNLEKKVYGQEYAAKKLASSIAPPSNKGNVNCDINKNYNKKFLFVGPTGVGKTEMANTVGVLNGGKFITIAMEGFPNEEHYSTLLGAGLGRGGSLDKPFFAKELDKLQPIQISQKENSFHYTLSNVVILFDEFEKAHPLIRNYFLSLFGESGSCTMHYSNEKDNYKLCYSFRNCIFICTTNLFQEKILSDFIKGEPIETIEKNFLTHHKTSHDPRKFSEEGIGRMTLIPFGPVPKGKAYQALIKSKIESFINRLKMQCKEVEVEDSTLILSTLEDKLYGDGTNIRKVNECLDEIERFIQSKWNDLTDMKITFFAKNSDIFIRPDVYLDLRGVYSGYTIEINVTTI